MTDNVRPIACGVTRFANTEPEFGPSLATTCTRARNHIGPHRGPETGTDRLVSWTVTGQELDEKAETWDLEGLQDRIDDSTTRLERVNDQLAAMKAAPPPELAGFWHAVAVTGPWLLWGALVAAAWLLPALVVIAWKAAL